MVINFDEEEGHEEGQVRPSKSDRAEIGLFLSFSFASFMYPILIIQFYFLSTGICLHTTASVAPTRAIHTTDTAEGTRVRYWAKCNFASRKPKADDFIAVSIAMVRH